MGYKCQNKEVIYIHRGKKQVSTDNDFEGTEDEAKKKVGLGVEDWQTMWSSTGKLVLILRPATQENTK